MAASRKSGGPQKSRKAAGTGAERQRRYRLHRRGDHSLCHPARCNPATVTQPVTPGGRPTLGVRGERLWRQYADEGVELAPAERVLLEEACRAADRLDTLDRLLRGEEPWLTMRAAEEGSPVVTLVVDRVLAEARQQQLALKGLLAELRQSRAPAKARGSSRSQAVRSESGVGGGVADLTARIAARRQASG